MIARILILAATAAIGGGAVLSRMSLNRQIEERMPTEVETACALAKSELNKQIKQVIIERLQAFTINLLTKASLIGAVYLLFDAGLLAPQGLYIVIGILVAVFVIRDCLNTLPYVAPAVKHIRQHNWRPRKALTEFIAGIAFERAYAETMLTMETGPNRLLVAFSKYSAQSISTEVGEAVREVARATSFDMVKWRLVIAALLALIMMGVYAGFVIVTIGAV